MPTFPTRPLWTECEPGIDTIRDWLVNGSVSPDATPHGAAEIARASDQRVDGEGDQAAEEPELAAGHRAGATEWVPSRTRSGAR